MKNQKTIDFLTSILINRFNDVTSFKLVKVDESKITNFINAFCKPTNYGNITVSVLTYDKNTESGDYIRIVSFNKLTLQF